MHACNMQARNMKKNKLIMKKLENVKKERKKLAQNPSTQITVKLLQSSSTIPAFFNP